MKDCVTYIARDKAQTDAVVARLLEIGFWDRDITVHFPHRQDSTESLNGQKSRATAGTILGGAIGAFTGGTLFLLASLGVIDLPGLSLLMSAGPVLATLSGAAAGAGFCAPAGGIVGLAILRSAAHREVQRSRPAVSVAVKNDDEREQAEAVFAQFGGPTPQPWVRPPAHVH